MGSFYMEFILDFGSWHSAIHDFYEQAKRISEGKKDLKPALIDRENKIAEFIGSKGNTYTTTLDSCSCGDFIKRRLPCKHIYSLANALGYIGNLPELKKEAASNFDINIEIARYYDLYKNGVISVDKFSRLADALSKK